MVSSQRSFGKFERHGYLVIREAEHVDFECEIGFWRNLVTYILIEETDISVSDSGESDESMYGTLLWKS